MYCSNVTTGCYIQTLAEMTDHLGGIVVKAKIAKLALASSVVVASAGITVQAYGATNPPITIEANEVASWQDNFNPYDITNAQSPQGTVYEPLFFFSMTGPQYDLLGTGFKWSKDKKTLTVTVRKGVKFNDGSPMTIKDVVYSYTILKKYPSLDSQQVWANISSVRAVGSNQVQFQFKNEDVPFAEILLSQVPIVPEKIWSKVKGDPSKWADPNPVGTGPYMLDQFTTQNFSMKVNPHFWGNKPAAPELEYPALAGNDSADNELVSGQLDWAGLFLQNIQSLYVSKNSATNHYYFPDHDIVSLFPNLRNPILADLQVRKAMSLAIDRSSISKLGEYGYEPVVGPSGLIPEAQKEWLAKGLPASFSSPNIKEANAILTKDGYKMGSDGYRSKNGKELSFNLIAPTGWTDWDEDETLIAQDLKQVGIKINVQEPQQGNWQAQLTNHTFQLALETAYSVVGNTPYFAFFNTLAPNGDANYEGYNNPATTKALSSFKTSTTLAQEKNAMATIEKSVAANLPVIPLVGGADWYEYSTKNYTGWPTQANDYVDAPPYTLYATDIVLTHLKRAK